MNIKTEELELRQLRAFDQVAHYLSFTRAAAHMHIAQSALSRLIQTLENSLGVKLFDRNRVRVRLTDAGRAYAPYVAKILAQVDIAATAAIEASKSQAYTLRLATDWRVTHPKVMSTIVAFRKAYPKVNLEISDMPMPDQADALKNGDIDIAFLPCKKFEIEGSLAYAFASAKMRLVLSSTHPLAEKSFVDIALLKNEQWLTIDGREGYGYRRFIADWCKGAGFAPKFYKAAKSVQSLVGMVGSQLGVALLPDFVVPLDSPMVVSIDTNVKTMDLEMTYLENPSALILSFLDVLKTQ